MFNPEWATAIQNKYIARLMTDGQPHATAPFKASLTTTLNALERSITDETSRRLPREVQMLLHEMDEYQAPVKLVIAGDNVHGACVAIPIHPVYDMHNEASFGPTEHIKVNFPFDIIQGFRKGLLEATQEGVLPNTIMVGRPYRKRWESIIPISAIRVGELRKVNDELSADLAKITGVR